ncbi:MAG: DNA-binding protein [Burkholderiales bacterium]
MSITMEEILLQQNGPLLNFQSLAKILNRFPEGLRISLRTESEWSKSINSARLK